jgi:Trk K+ transport system NAD-binding subunit
VRPGLDGARAVGVLGPLDLENLGAALLVADLAPDARIVVRTFSPDLGRGVEQMLHGRGKAYSEIELAGPLLVQAALSGNAGQRISVAGRMLEVAEVERDDPALLVALCDADDPDRLLPPPHTIGRAALALVDTKTQQPPPRRRRRRASGWLRTVPKRAYLLLGAIVGVFAISVLVFGFGNHLGAIDAIYFTATTMATVGYGDVSLAHSSDLLKLYDVGLMAVSAVLLASLLAIAADMLVSSRIDRALGRFPRPRQDHVIVCGLGKAGSRVLTRLHDLGVPCVGVESSQNAVGVPVARRLEIPVVFADARSPGTLNSVHVQKARAVMAVTSDDLVNLETALAARGRNPAVPVVMRIFDPKLADRLDRGVELDITRSMSALAAPVFAAALLNRPPTQPISLPHAPLRVLETDLPDGSPLAGLAVKDVHETGGLRVLAADGRWQPPEDLVLHSGMAVSVVATRSALDALLEQSDEACPPSPSPSRSPRS